MANYDSWEPTGKELGKGGQGTVYLARSPKRVQQAAETADQIRQLLRETTKTIEVEKWIGLGRQGCEKLVQSIVKLASDDPAELGALKVFAIPSDDKEEEAKALGRLKTEVEALIHLDHPAVLKLLHHNLSERFIVTEYHPNGTLDKQLHRYKGNVLKALEAFRPLVDAVVEIHKGYHPRAGYEKQQVPRDPAIHRDIKPENVFVTESGDLVLGDFGIVFFQNGGRLTTTFERVGSHYWMAPWAYDNVRLEFDQIKPPLDIYPLGKVLWSMISGRNGFPYWEYDREENNLEKLFLHDPLMPLVNGVISKCVVREEKDCLPSAEALRLEIDNLIKTLKLRRGSRPEGADTWPCTLCGVGSYSLKRRIGVAGEHAGAGAGRHFGGAVQDRVYFDVYVCGHCKHVELFSPRIS